MPRTIRQAAEAFAAYDRKTTKDMAKLRSQGSGVRQPVRSTKGASASDLWDRAKFLYRKSSQILSLGQPLQNKDGTPTPAAMQFKRWAAPIPKTLEDVRKIKAQATRLKEKYRPKE
jgi:hypothetical protein